METKATAGRPVYEDFVPSYKLVREEGIDTLIVELSEFKKEQVRIQVENFGNLSISGERPLADNRWSRFRNVFEVPKECNDIRIKFENGRLYVKVLPKLSNEATMEAAIKIKKEDQLKQVESIKPEEMKGKEKFEIRQLVFGFSKPMQILVNLIVAVVVLVVMALYMTSKK